MLKYQKQVSKYTITPMIYQRLFILIGLFTLFHMITAATTGLGDDEAYYWQWSQHLALSYYDHPPLIAYLVYLSTKLFGNSPFAVRLPNLLMLPLASLLVFRICNYLYRDSKISLNGVIIFNLLPPFLLGSILVSPDAPLLFCYSLALYLFVRIIYKNDARLWYLLGIVLGLGLLSKYTMLIFVFSVVLYLILNKIQRFWFRKKEPYIALIVAFILFTPVLIWNYQQHFASFEFQFYNRHSFHPKISHFFGFIGLQLLVLSPVFGIAMVIIWVKKFKTPEILLLSCFSLPVFVVFALVAIFTPIRFNWSIIAYIPLVIIFVSQSDKLSLTYKWGTWTTLVLCGIVTLQTYYPIIKIKPLKSDPTSDFYSWQPVAIVINDFLSSPGVNHGDWFVAANRFQSAAQIDYNLRGRYPVYSLPNHIDGPSFWQDESQTIGKNALLVMNDAYQFQPEEKYKCAKMSLYKVIDIVRAGTVFRQAYIYQCYNYQGRK